MAGKRRDDPLGQPQIAPDVAIRLLNEQIRKARTLLELGPLTKDVYGQWELVTRNYLEKAFGVGSPNVSSITDVGKYVFIPSNADDQWWENRHADSLTSQVNLLDGLVQLLETERQLQSDSVISAPEPGGSGHRRVFLVHGHDEAALHVVARFLETLKQDVIVLRDQPNRGMTIIEKFEEYSDVAFAVVLLTPDDLGGPAGGDPGDQSPRARQNVLLELGYFLGRLSRQRVCALYSEGVEIPSDYTGVLYVLLDSGGGWRLQLAKELQAAGLPIDMNLAL